MFACVCKPHVLCIRCTRGLPPSLSCRPPVHKAAPVPAPASVRPTRPARARQELLQGPWPACVQRCVGSLVARHTAGLASPSTGSHMLPCTRADPTQGRCLLDKAMCPATRKRKRAAPAGDTGRRRPLGVVQVVGLVGRTEQVARVGHPLKAVPVVLGMAARMVRACAA